MMIIFWPLVTGKVEFRSMAFAPDHSGHIRSIAFLDYNFLSNRDREVGFVTLCSARRETSTDTPIDFLRVKPD